MGKHLAKRHYIIAILLVLLLSLTAIAGISFALPEAGTVYAAADTGHEVKLVYRYYTVNGTVTSYAVTAVSYDENAQLNKDNLKIVIPATYQNKPVTEIDDGVFSKANNSGYTFTSLDISSATNLKKIGATAFKGQTSLTGNLTIPNSVTSIGASAFMGCTGFTGNLTIPDSVTKIDFGAFNNCTGLQTIYLPNNTTMTFGSNNAFSNVTCPIVASNKSQYDAHKAKVSNLTYEITVTFDANGGSISGESTQIKLFGKSLKYVKSVNGIWAENEEYALPTASKSNCNFDGWNSEAAGGGSGISITRAI